MESSCKPDEKEKKCVCPYCEEEIIAAGFAYCKPCGVSLRYCAKCGVAVSREVEVCPQCGGDLEWK